MIPENLRQHPRLAQWLAVAPDGRVRAFSGKVEIGQGILHALRLVVAEELGVSPQEVEMVPASTATSPDEAVTSGSQSVQQSGAALRYAAAHLRALCEARAGATADWRYVDLVDAAMLATEIDPSFLRPREGRASLHAALPRDDVAQKVFGEFTFLQDMELPGLLHGQVHRPGTLQATLDDERWSALRPRLAALPGVIQVVRDGLLVGVLAHDHAVLAQAQALVDKAPPWRAEADVPELEDIPAWLKSQAHETTVVAERGDAPAADRVFRAEYGRAWLQHASIGLSCSIAQWRGPELQVWSHSQGIFNLRRDLALAFGLPADAVTVDHVPGAGCYGHNGADDVAFDAAWLARHAQGRPVRLQWTRAQELANSPLGPAMRVAIEAAVDAIGRIVGWKQEVWSQGHGSRPGRGKSPALLGAWQVERAAPVTMAINPPASNGGGADRNCVPPYAVPRLEVLNHRVLSMPLRVSALRSLGAHVNVLAAESMMDEIARALGRDPLEHRLDHLEDERGRAVLREAVRIAGPRPVEEAVGRGIGYARYKNTGAWCAVVAEVAVAEKVRVRKLWIAADLGLVVHPDGARNQIEGGAVQAASWTLLEAARLGPAGVQSNDWERYPIFRFGDAPAVQVALIDRPDMPSVGAGECSMGPTAAAIANAIHDAVGLRMRDLPITPERLLRAAQDA